MAPPAGSVSGDYAWFECPLEIRALPATPRSVPVSTMVPLGLWASGTGLPGDVDERSITLVRVVGGKATVEPVQLSSAPALRPGGRRLRAGTPDTVSYLVEEDITPELKPAQSNGLLSWFAQPNEHGRAQYRVRFGILKKGTRVQVPYPPYHWRHFGPEGRATPAQQFPVMQIRPQFPLNGEVGVFEGENLVTRYHTGPTPQEIAAGVVGIRRPFLYPLIGPDGAGLTGFGKPHDPTGSHAHHYSLWIAHALVNGLDFWSERGGVIVHENFEDLEDGPVFCRIVQNTSWRFGETNLLREQRSIAVFRAAGEDRLLDFQLAFTPAQSNIVQFGKTTFGFLATRVAQSMSVFDGGGEIQNARGDLNEGAAHLKPAEWLDQSGPVASGRWNGIAILDHPANPGHPVVWHCRNDGWAGASVTAGDELGLQPGQWLTLRYRLVLHRGDARQAGIPEHFAAYRAKPHFHWGQSARLPNEQIYENTP